MSLRRHLPFSNRDQLAHWLWITGLFIGGLAHADSPLSESKSEIKLVAPPTVGSNQSAVGTTQDNSNIFARETAPPTSSDENWEVRVARRPWLLEKLVGPETVPSRKMDPPRPPIDLPDPPSMSRIVPEKSLQPVQKPSHAKVPGHRRELTRTPKLTPLTDPSFVPQQETVSQQETVLPPESTTSPDSNQPTLEIDIAESDSAEIDSAEIDSAEIDSVEIEPPPTDTDVSIRELQIQRDGTPANRESTDPQTVSERVSSGPVDAPSHETYVGDLDVESIEEPGIVETIPLESADPSTDPVSPIKVPIDYTGHPLEQIRPTRNVIRLRGMMQQCLRYYYERPEIANERSNWGMMHAIMVYGIDTKVVVGRKQYSAIAWIAGNNACRGQKILTQVDGKIAATNGVGLQGHQGQLLAILSLAGVPANYSLYGGNRKYSVNDLIDTEMRACKSGEELTFTLIGLSHYVDTESEWLGADGETWNFEKLIQEELSQPIVGAACGGSHRLMAFAHALRARRAEQLPITGQWKRADEYTKSFEQYTYRLQNRDGSMSTDWFEGREDNGDMERKVQTTGHMVEWLLTVTPDSQLQNPRLVNAIGFLLKTMYEERDTDWEIGPKGHALRSLAMYYERVYQSGPAWRTQSVAQRGNSRQR